MGLPREFYASLLLLRINTIRNSCEVISQLLQPRDELSGLILNTFVFLGNRQWQIEAVQDHPTS